MMKFISKDIKMPLILPLREETSPKSNTVRSVVRVVAPNAMDIILEVSIKKRVLSPYVRSTVN